MLAGRVIESAASALRTLGGLRPPQTAASSPGALRGCLTSAPAPDVAAACAHMCVWLVHLYTCHPQAIDAGFVYTTLKAQHCRTATTATQSSRSKVARRTNTPNAR